MTMAGIGRFLRHNWLLAALVSFVLAFLAVHLVWYIHPSDDITSVDDLDARLTDGQPTVVEFYTNL